MATLIVPRAHSAAVTGLEILASSVEGSITIATASLDQHLKTWDLHIDLAKPGIESTTVRKVQKMFTPVADVSGMALFNQKPDQSAVILCGVGMDVWRHKSTVEEI